MKKKHKTNYRILALLMAFALFGGCTQAGNETPGDNGTPTGTASVTQSAVKTPEATATPTQTSTSTPTPTFTPTPTNTPTPVPELTITMAGDILLHTGVENDCLQADGTYDYSSIFANTKDFISSFDVALVNQEVIIGGSELGVSGYPRFNAGFELADALADAGFDVILHATNHALDKGKTGILNCLENWERFPDIDVLGIYLTEQDAEDQIVYIEKNGIRISILNFTYGTNGISVPSSMPWAVGPLLVNTPNAEGKEGAVKKITDLIDKAEANSDFTIVCPHWGSEYSTTQSANQREWNRIFYDHGADLVMGTHSHVVQPMVIVNNETTLNVLKYDFDRDQPKELRSDQMLVYYSLGNFVNWTEESGEKILKRMVGGMPEITLGLDDNGEVVIKDFNVRAVVTHVATGRNLVSVYKLEDYNEEMARENEIANRAGTELTIGYCKELLNSVWGDLWR
ncbi:MAG: CapA family protein [Lachnospiraceae bacterium]|nr:CapA family protein [Lachnospiraceae bacterium]